MPKKQPKRQKKPPLSLFPLSLEEALRKALSIPFDAPKKKNKKRK